MTTSARTYTTPRDSIATRASPATALPRQPPPQPADLERLFQPAAPDGPAAGQPPDAL